MAHDSLFRPFSAQATPYRRVAALLLLCGAVGLGACSAPDSTTTDPQPAGDATEAPAAGDRPEKKALTADKAARRLTRMSSKLYESAYANNWEQAAQQFNRLQKLSDRIEASQSGAAEAETTEAEATEAQATEAETTEAEAAVGGTAETEAAAAIDIAALQQQLDTLSDAITAEQQVPAMVAANQLIETGLQVAQTANDTAKFLPAAQLGYQARQLELAALGPDGTSGGIDPQKVETMDQAAQQVIQTWETIGGTGDATADATADTATGATTTPTGAVAKLDEAIAQLRQAPVDEYPALARQIIEGSQKMMTNRQK